MAMCAPGTLAIPPSSSQGFRPHVPHAPVQEGHGFGEIEIGRKAVGLVNGRKRRTNMKSLFVFWVCETRHSRSRHDNAQNTKMRACVLRHVVTGRTAHATISPREMHRSAGEATRYKIENRPERAKAGRCKEKCNREKKSSAREASRNRRLQGGAGHISSSKKKAPLFGSDAQKTRLAQIQM